MEIEGMIIRDLGQFDGISKAGNPWKKHEWVLETIGQYPRKVKFTVFGDRVNTMTFELGKTYVISVDAESREFNERWYTDLTAYASRLSENQNNGPEGPTFSQPTAPASQPAPAAQAPNPFKAPEADFTTADPQEDLPF